MKIKKIVTGVMLGVILVLQFSNVAYAVLSCNADIVLSKVEISKDEIFTVDFNLTNVEADKGIISLGATLDYDKDSLELVKMEGKNEWDTPSGNSFNKENGKMILTRDSICTSSETVFTMTFKLKDTSKSEIPISLKDIVVADGYAPVKISAVSKNIKVSKTQKPDDKPENDDLNNNKPDNNNNGDNNNLNNNQNSSNKNNTNNGNNVSNNNSNQTSKDNTKTTLRLPNTGENSVVFMILIGVASIFAVIFCFKIRMINKKK